MSVPPPCELPPPPPGETGWPWTVQSQVTYEAGVDWPKITVVTPSFNQGQYIERTLRSVLLQGYPNLEYVVIDGGSTDRSVETIRKYAPWISRWVSEADRGQSHAINKGFAGAAGEVFAWLNSDDRYTPGALAAVGRRFAGHADCQWLSGAAAHVRTDDGRTVHCPAHLAGGTALLDFWRFGDYGHYVKQSSVFWRSRLWEAVGGLSEELHLAMDHDLWLKFDEHAPMETLDDLLSVAILHDQCKSLRDGRRQAREAMRCCYAAARRRGRSANWLTWRFLADAPRWRLGRALRNGRLRWWGGVVRELAAAAVDPIRLWSETGRLSAIRGNR